jgi:hypothetical protein
VYTRLLVELPNSRVLGKIFTCRFLWSECRGTKLRNVVVRFLVSFHGHKGYSRSPPTSSSSTNNEFLIKYYANKHGVHDLGDPEHDFHILVKEELAQGAAYVAECPVATVFTRSWKDPSEEILFVFFALYKPPYISSTVRLPTEDRLQGLSVIG